MLEITPMTLKEANAYVEQNHRHHGPVVGHKFSIGCSDGEKIVGVAIVGRPVARHLDDGWTLEVNRLCTDGTRNACSMLYAAAWRAARAMGYKRLVTYILESENGARPFWVRHYRGVRMSKKTTDETLGRESVKEYLQQYHAAVGKKRILEERHRVLSSELRAPSTGSAFRLTPPTKPTKTDGSVSVVFRISEVEDRIEEQREEMAKAVLNVMDLIDVLPANSTERTVVEMRHIDCRGWDKIAEALYMSRSNVFNYYNAALDKILENKRNRKLLEEYMARKQQRAGPHGRNNRP